MAKSVGFMSPEHVLGTIYGKSSLALKMSEKRRDEVIAAAIFTSFRNQEFGTNFKLPADYEKIHHAEDARGIDIVVASDNGRLKKLQIKGIYISRAIRRRRRHETTGAARVLGRKSQRQIQRDSLELAQVMKVALERITQDYSGLFLIIYVNADLATQTSLEIAMRKSAKRVEKLQAQEIWFLRNIPVRAIRGKASRINCFTYELLKVKPDRHTYVFSFAL
ncbi:MAG: hypothetical protein Q8R76_09665 [Candidatus Omnitrophota bacterium]|nr:hypothetical protein [Candidatus Omnitrophota bacterium]